MSLHPLLPRVECQELNIVHQRWTSDFASAQMLAKELCNKKLPSSR
jgi:hypothetical protein